MAESRFTPGEWSVAHLERDGCKCGYVFNPGGATVARILYNDPTLDKYERQEETITLEEAKANAHLIAAAPEMYTALKRIEPIVEAMASIPGNFAEPGCLADQLRAALAKAEGRDA